MQSHSSGPGSKLQSAMTYVKGEDEFLALTLSRMWVSASPLSRDARNLNMCVNHIYNMHIRYVDFGCYSVS